MHHGTGQSRSTSSPASANQGARNKSAVELGYEVLFRYLARRTTCLHLDWFVSTVISSLCPATYKTVSNMYICMHMLSQRAASGATPRRSDAAFQLYAEVGISALHVGSVGGNAPWRRNPNSRVAPRPRADLTTAVCCGDWRRSWWRPDSDDWNFWNRLPCTTATHHCYMWMTRDTHVIYIFLIISSFISFIVLLK